MKQTKWISTAKAADRLGMSKKTLYRLIKNKALRKGVHYRIINPKSKRKTYQFNQDMIDFYGQT